MTIPAKLHFCWIGDRLPWAYVFAVLSAADQSMIPEITLHHTDTLKCNAALQALKQKPSVTLSHLEPHAYLSQVGNIIGVGDDLSHLYQRLDSAVMRSDVLRVAILYLEGGVYMDLDTVTVASLLPLLDTTAFIGSEFLVWPQNLGSTYSFLLRARQLMLDVLRKFCRKVPQGWIFFKKIENFYFRSANNAIMGSEAKSAFISDYIHSMLRLHSQQLSVRCSLGPHLLQHVAGRHTGASLTTYEPVAFYPMPPEISEHWFRTVRTTKLDSVLSQKTCIVHWYASVRTKRRVAQITPDYVQRHRERQMYSALVCEMVRDLPKIA